MKTQYAILPYRVKAAFIDSLILVTMMYVASEVFSLFESIPNYIRIIVSAFIFFLYDPIFTSAYGGTIGHSYSGISVKRDNDNDKNITFPTAIIRFIFKAFFGWISLLTVAGNEKRKAIHDFIAKSVVIENPSE
jgi:uncharacterized RDD family membrane protein YckC